MPSKPTPLSDQMFAVLDLIVCGAPPNADIEVSGRTVDALVRRGLVERKPIIAEHWQPEYIFAQMGGVCLIGTDTGRKRVAEAEAGRASP